MRVLGDRRHHKDKRASILPDKTEAVDDHWEDPWRGNIEVHDLVQEGSKRLHCWPYPQHKVKSYEDPLRKPENMGHQHREGSGKK